MKKVLFVGGGSAGHVVPNIALIDCMLRMGKMDVCYMGTDGLEKTLIAPMRIPYYQISCPKLIRGGGFSALKNNWSIPKKFKQAVKEAEAGLKIFSPDLVFSKGGYVSLPVVTAASKMEIPCITHESDFSLGLANKLMVKKCATVLTAFPETADKLKNGKYVGQPIRKSLFTASRHGAKLDYCDGTKKPVVLILGGGSGSVTINNAVRADIRNLCDKYFILHVCGKGNVVDSTMKDYRQYEYVSNMGDLYAAADVVVSRAGAGALFETLALKKPAVFIPLVKQTRGDQLENARYFERRGLCKVLQENELSKLDESISQALEDADIKDALSTSRYGEGTANTMYQIFKHLCVR
ncbi:MAG: UDP-N-acetylglucosamine--N-acetylmuramyl-(pentapeptide) pyrophosphoryl-undecaprenol N-acetylglucosamine transferase [Clostridia bacterium]|nr:UDP-N-acetylglucosamine--N-acetylmuramyl-(pentapeptide) pyrophosphoryl-undecaprenol N-acetylglucosamine transferase [Clostridia bacterium]